VTREIAHKRAHAAVGGDSGPTWVTVIGCGVSLSQFGLRLKGPRNKMAGFFVELVEMTFSSTKRRTTTMPAQPKSTTGPGMLTVRELAGYLRVHQTTVYRLLREQKLPAFRVGAAWRFNRQEIERWMTHERK